MSVPIPAADSDPEDIDAIRDLDGRPHPARARRPPEEVDREPTDGMEAPGAIADEIIATMVAAGYAIRGSNPFNEQPVMTLPARETSPYVNRIKLLWQRMRGPVIEAFPHSPGLLRNKAAYMKGVEEPT